MTIASLMLAVTMSQTQAADKRTVDQIVHRINADKGTKADRDSIQKMGDRAFPFLYPHLQATSRKFVQTNHIGHTMELIWLAFLCAGPSRTTEMRKLYDGAKQYPKNRCFTWLATIGNPIAGRTLFETELSGRNGQDAATGLARIADAKAIATLKNYLSAVVDNDDAPFILASFGSINKPEVRQTIAKLFNHGRTVPKLLDRCPINGADKSHFSVKSTHIDASGTKWGLATWRGLGNSDDLWLVKWAGGTWTAPTFTGVTSYWPMSNVGIDQGAEKHDAEMKALIEDKGWVKKFVGNPDLTRDTDLDGMPDLLERWIGLNPDSADSDGDGIPDTIDKNPLAGPAGEAELPVRAALETFVFDRRRPDTNVIVRVPEAMPLFELESPMCPVYMFHDTKSESSPSKHLFGFWYSVRSMPKRVRNGDVEVEVRHSGGWYDAGYRLTMRRFDKQWICVKIDHTYSAVS